MRRVTLEPKMREYARNEIAKWGYHRDLNDYAQDLILARVGKSAAWMWFERIEPRKDWLFIHMCANPECRGRWATSHVVESIYWITELSGGRRVYTIARDGSDVVDYVKRLGWIKDNIGWFADV